MNNFEEIVEFHGQLSDGENTVENLHFIITYSLINSGLIKGKIIGSHNTYTALSKLMNSSKLKLKSRMGNQEYNCEEVYIHQLSSKEWGPNSKNIMTFEVADLNLYEFNKIHYFENNDYEKRYLTFHLSGPSDIFNVCQMREKSFDGSIRNEVKDLKLCTFK